MTLGKLISVNFKLPGSPGTYFLNASIFFSAVVLPMMEKYNNPSKKKSFFMVIEFLLSYFTSLIKDTEITLQWFFEFMLT